MTSVDFDKPMSKILGSEYAKFDVLYYDFDFHNELDAKAYKVNYLGNA